jgi:hypothetical protein
MFFRPDSPSSFRHVKDEMIEATQRHDGPRFKRDGIRQSFQARPDPRCMPFRECFRVGERNSLWHGQHDSAARMADAQCQAARYLRASQLHAVHTAGVLDVDMICGSR